jgi:hypothetical protein
MGVVRKRRWPALTVMLAVLLAASLAFGEDPTPCYEAYRTSGLTQEQMGFGEFRELYGDGVCAASRQDT